MRFRMVFFAFAISVCVIGAGDSHAGWAGSCHEGYIDCVNVDTFATKTLETRAVHFSD